MRLPYVLLNATMFDSNNMRFMSIAHTWDNGDIDYINVLDNKMLTTDALDGKLVPDWYRERVALLRMCDVTKTGRGETIGKKFTEHMIYVYLDKKDYNALTLLIEESDQ